MNANLFGTPCLLCQAMHSVSLRVCPINSSGVKAGNPYRIVKEENDTHSAAGYICSMT